MALSGPPPEDHPRRCHATSKRTGKRCGGWGMQGTEPPVCATHGGKAPQVKRKAAERVKIAEAHERAQRMVAAAGVDLDPIEHLLESLHLAAALVYVYGQMVADLDNKGEVDANGEPGRLRGWAERRLEEGLDGKWRSRLDHDPLLVQSSEDTVHLHPFVKEYHAALERRAKFAKMALDAGVAERQVRLAERQGQLIIEVLRRSLVELGQSVDDGRVAEVVSRHLRALPSGNVA